ncbi:MAG: GNAT family N-acetyltransferase [Paludibacteraceae bacterium]|nr:GNAT family N-acetyltransferase [Paludibacteraceae bacterium]
MAKIDNKDHSLRRGKMNKKDNEIHRVRNGKEHVYSVRNEYDGPASEAQTAQRSNFGKISSIVNRIMADPAQVADFEQRMHAANTAAVVNLKKKPYETVRQYVYAVIRDQIELTTPPPTQLPKGVNLHIRTFADLSTSELYEILKARYAVFTQEQGIIYLDEDDIDYISTHIFLTRGPQVIAYARLFREKIETTLDPDKYELVSNDNIFHLGRMLTTIRHQGFGTRLMHSVLAEARRQSQITNDKSPMTNPPLLRLHAQTHAIPFYERFGFHPVGDIFEEANIPHILMEMSL